MGILNLVSNKNYITVNRTLIKKVGLNEAIMLGELAGEYYYWERENKLDEYGQFFSTAENLQEMTSLSPYQQRTAIKNLEDAGLLHTFVKGLPAKKYFRLNIKKIEEVILED